MTLKSCIESSSFTFLLYQLDTSKYVGLLKPLIWSNEQAGIELWYPMKNSRRLSLCDLALWNPETIGICA